VSLSGSSSSGFSEDMRKEAKEEMHRQCSTPCAIKEQEAHWLEAA